MRNYALDAVSNEPAAPNSHLVDAFCCGRPVRVAVKPVPVDHRQVLCPACGAPRGAECVDIETGLPNFTGHASRHVKARRARGLL